MIEAAGRARLQLGRQLCDYFYASYSRAHQQSTLLERQEEALRLLGRTDDAAVPLGERVAAFKQQGLAINSLRLVRPGQGAAR